MYYFSIEARVGFEPANEGFADLAIRPLWYRADVTEELYCEVVQISSLKSALSILIKI